MKNLIANHSWEVTYKGTLGVWFSGSAKFSNNLASSIFLPITLFQALARYEWGYYYYADIDTQKGGMLRFSPNGSDKDYLLLDLSSENIYNSMNKDAAGRCVKD